MASVPKSEYDALLREVERLRKTTKFLRSERPMARKLSEAQTELEQLRQRVKELEAERSVISGHLIKSLHEKLAASQLDNLRLRSALEKALHWTSVADMSLFSRYSAVVDTLRDAEALSTLTDTEALEKYLADKLGEPVAFKVVRLSDNKVDLLDRKVNLLGHTCTPLYPLKEKP